MCPRITQFGCFFLRKLRCSELNSFSSEFLVTLLGEKALSSDLLHPFFQFRLAVSQLASTVTDERNIVAFSAVVFPGRI